MEEKNISKHTYFGESTASQRRLLFEEWKRTGNVTKVCEKAKLQKAPHSISSRFFQFATLAFKETRRFLKNKLPAPHHL